MNELPDEKHETESTQTAIEGILASHVVEIAPLTSGRKELIKGMADAAIGAADVEIGRTYPPLSVESAVLAKGKMKILIGPNGAGKSTVFDAIMERGAHFETQGGKGALVVGTPTHTRDNLRVARLDQEEILGRINEIQAGEFLERTAEFFKKQFPVDWEDAEHYELNTENQGAQTRIEILMDQLAETFELKDFWDRKVGELSGGERTKLALFTMLLSEPDVFLFDEPTNHLDLQSITKLVSLFERYRDAGAAVVNVSHVDWFLSEAGRDGVLEIIWNKGTRALRESKKSYDAYAKNPTRERTPIISGDIEWVQKDYHYKQGEAVIESPAKFTVPDSPLVDINFPVIHGGDLLILSGKNGSGKTRLLESFTTGSGENKPRRTKGTNIAYLPQFWPESMADATLDVFFEWIKESTNLHGKGSAYHYDQPAKKFFTERARELSFGGSSQIGASWLKCPIRQFSGGEQRILWFLAVSAIRNVDVLILDEPTNHMDLDLQKKVTDAIRRFPGAVLISTHDRNLMTSLTEDGGKLTGAVRKPIHVTLQKKEGKSVAAVAKENPVQYMERVMREARQQSKRLKI